MRLFVAVEIPENIKQQLSDQIDFLITDYPEFQWVDPLSYHVTLRYFGNYPNVISLKQKIKNALFEIDPFWMYGWYMNLFMKQHITIHVGFRRQKTLEKLVENMHMVFGDNTFEHQTFVPHVTVARTKIPSKQQYFHLRKKLDRKEIDIEFEVNSVSLFDSRMEMGKPKYEKLEEFKFG